jgi:hypothetical protein
MNQAKTIRLGINTGFALNRFPEAEVWAKIIGQDLNLRYVQFTADLLNASLPQEIIEDQISQINRACKRYNVSIEHSFTSAFTRVNHLASPDTKIRQYWIQWFKRFADISKRLGAVSMGSHFAILSVNDLKNRKEEMTQKVISGWHEIAKYAKEKGLQYLTWEPMSIPREFGENIKNTKELHERLNHNAPLPFKLCLDVDHGDVSSKNPDDANPHKWLEVFGKDSPIIHIKQSLKNKSGHHPFAAEYNKDGKIVPGEIVGLLQKYGCDNTLLLFEFSFREREPYESLVLEHLKESVEYWRPFVSI